VTAVITQAGVYDIPDVDYHADPVAGGSLSSTVARKMLPPSCPALALWAATHPEFKDAYDLGSATHRLILGAGQELIEVDADSWRSPKTRAQRDEARARGAVALLSHDLRKAEAMAKAVHEHPVASALLAPGTGHPERTVVWADPETGVWCRAMLDWFPTDDGWVEPIAVDVKTTDSAASAAIAKTVANYGYQQQRDFYGRGLASAGLVDVPFLFVFVEKDPPHLVRVVELDSAAEADGHTRNARALRLWAACRETGIWPGYGDDIELIGLPRWATYTQDYL
jgi:hypothetical protein